MPHYSTMPLYSTRPHPNASGQPLCFFPKNPHLIFHEHPLLDLHPRLDLVNFLVRFFGTKHDFFFGHAIPCSAMPLFFIVAKLSRIRHSSIPPYSEYWKFCKCDRQLGKWNNDIQAFRNFWMWSQRVFTPAPVHLLITDTTCKCQIENSRVQNKIQWIPPV